MGTLEDVEVLGEVVVQLERHGEGLLGVGGLALPETAELPDGLEDAVGDLEEGDDDGQVDEVGRVVEEVVVRVGHDDDADADQTHVQRQERDQEVELVAEAQEVQRAVL